MTKTASFLTFMVTVGLGSNMALAQAPPATAPSS